VTQVARGYGRLLMWAVAGARKLVGMKNLPLSRIMNSPMVTISPDSTLPAARALMEQKGVHHLLILEGNRLAGIVSSADFLKIALLQDPGVDSAAQTGREPLFRIRDIMQTRVAVLPGNASLKEAARALLLGGFHALPVVAVDGSPIGMLTSSDLAALLIEQLELEDPGVERIAAPPGDAPRAEIASLREVLRAAEVYLHSGQSGQQHARLAHAVARARELGARAQHEAPV
jgi:CBS domain-containing protein